MRRMGLSDVLKRLEERNKNQDQPNGLFASHPLIKDRHRRTSAARSQQDKLTASATVAAALREEKSRSTAKPLAGDSRSSKALED